MTRKIIIEKNYNDLIDQRVADNYEKVADLLQIKAHDMLVDERVIIGKGGKCDLHVDDIKGDPLIGYEANFLISVFGRKWEDAKEMVNGYAFPVFKEVNDDQVLLDSIKFEMDVNDTIGNLVDQCFPVLSKITVKEK